MSGPFIPNSDASSQRDLVPSLLAQEDAALGMYVEQLMSRAALRNAPLGGRAPIPLSSSSLLTNSTSYPTAAYLGIPLAHNPASLLGLGTLPSQAAISVNRQLELLRLQKQSRTEALGLAANSLPLTTSHALSPLMSANGMLARAATSLSRDKGVPASANLDSVASTGGALSSATAHPGPKPGPKDVIMGRGKRGARLMGNRKLHKLLEKYHSQYEDSGKTDKLGIAEIIYEKMIAQGSRFLTPKSYAAETCPSPETSDQKFSVVPPPAIEWSELDETEAVTRISNGFRNLRRKKKRAA